LLAIGRLDFPNNDVERALRPSVIFRNITFGFRSSGGADLYAATPFVISTASFPSMSFGTRMVPSFDQSQQTMAVAAARSAVVEAPAKHQQN
jgi:hypothetical protein